MEIIYLEPEDIELLHDKAIELHGGLLGRPPYKLEGLLSIPLSGFGDYEHYPTIIEKAAVYHYHLASGHAFLDGNKRTSFLAMFTFLDWNGYELYVDPHEAFLWTLEIAQDKEKRPPFEDAVVWLERYTNKVGEEPGALSSRSLKNSKVDITAILKSFTDQ